MNHRLVNLLLFLFGFLICNPGNAQIDRRVIKIPDILGYKTLKCDLHLHTVFSDGTVWPTERVEEAWREGLDAISITDHIESRYRIYLNRLFGGSGSGEEPVNIPDHNMSYEVARGAAQKRDILLIKGGEITRSMPPGHSNAIFLTDVNKLDTPDWKDAFREAKKQGAFIFYNHPHFPPPEEKIYPPGTIRWWDEHT